jgi:diguanylate cyclase (GGDEF)-like protein
MSEADEILRSCVHLLGKLSGAASVSLYLPAGAPGEREILIHEGRLAPLPELADVNAAAEFHRQFGEAPALDDGAKRRASRSGDGELHRVSLRSSLRSEADALSRERRKLAPESSPADPAAWIGVRFDPPSRASVPGDEQLWKGFVGLAAAFASHARSVSRTLLDQVTGLPERTEFQAELEAALVRAGKTGLPLVLLLLAPDDFGWVNERLDRRAGDRVLLEVATGLRGGLRSRDHVARYGGAIFTVILFDTGAEDGRRVAENLVRRLGEYRYHEALRLEFSAGVAAFDAAEPIDAHELVRRADQALSAAKRGQAGSVRLWEKGSEVERAASLDRLQGIFTGDRSKDYRNMGLLLDQVAVVAGSTDPAELARRFTQGLFLALHARRVGVLEHAEGRFVVLAGVERTDTGSQDLLVLGRDRALLERALGEHTLVAEAGSEPGALSLCVLPLFLEDRCLGAILLEVTSVSISFEGSDRKFLDALGAQMAVALDRARLADRERRRMREESERLEAEVKDLRRVVRASRIAYRSTEMETVLSAARKVAGTDTTVLITGESGTGKEMLAHTVHDLSRRHERPLVVVDCGAISASLIESDLFGHERGAFTGAHTRKLGRLAQANGGTVFLDEIGDLPLDLQGKLLRFVQEKQLTPVGGVEPRKVDVRIIAATNVDLRARVAEGRFRDDLYHRLNVVRLQLPPLRERRQDIVHLASLFLQQFSALYRRPAQRFSARAEQALEAYAWPGNVRELQNLMLTTVLFHDDAEVDLEHLRGLSTEGGSGLAESASASIPEPAHSHSEGPAERSGAGSAASSPAAAMLRQALAQEIAAALRAAAGGLVPIGKWLAEDLVLAADRLAGGTSRRASQLLGLPDTTYRRQLEAATSRNATGQRVRSGSWTAVTSVLDDFIRARRTDIDVCQWAEVCLLAEVESAVPGEARKAAALLGVTEPTLLRRKTELTRHS